MFMERDWEGTHFPLKKLQRNTLQEKTMNRLITSIILIPLILFFLYGCGGKDINPNAFHGPVYPPTTRVNYIFQAAQAEPNCHVFAELLISMPAGINGATMHEKLDREARVHGADFVLIGQSRRMKDDEGFTFAYFGPRKEYRCNEQWCGWKYSYDAWDRQGEFVNIGLGEWGNKNAHFPYPVMLQAVFLRCQ